MNGFPNTKVVEEIKKKYPCGTRIRLIRMCDPYTKIPEGTEGTVVGVDGIGTIFVNWDNGSSLGVVYGEDECEVIA